MRIAFGICRNAEYGEPNITTKTTMKEAAENPSIKGSGYYTYCNEWIEGSTLYDDTPIEGLCNATRPPRMPPRA